MRVRFLFKLKKAFICCNCGWSGLSPAERALLATHIKYAEYPTCYTHLNTQNILLATHI